MALVVLLRGINVGGHRTFRPSLLARELEDYGVVNIGAAGTFVVRKPIPQAKLRAELLRRLPFKTEIIICSGRELINAAAGDPFAGESFGPDVVRFVSVLAKRPGVVPSLPLSLPSVDTWLLRIIAVQGRFAFGLYRRRMRAIGYLNQIDKRLGVPVTTRNWNTISAIVKTLKSDHSTLVG